MLLAGDVPWLMHLRLRLHMPQWQGGNLAEYHLGSQMLSWLLPPTDGPEETVAIPLAGKGTLKIEDGILAKAPLLKQARAARVAIERHRPDRVLTIGGDCLVDLAPIVSTDPLQQAQRENWIPGRCAARPARTRAGHQFASRRLGSVSNGGAGHHGIHFLGRDRDAAAIESAAARRCLDVRRKRSQWGPLDQDIKIFERSRLAEKRAFSELVFYLGQQRAIDPGRDPSRREVLHQRAAAKIAGGTGCIGAATQATGGGIEDPEPELPGGIDIGERQAAGIVEMACEPRSLRFLEGRLHHGMHTLWRRLADRVGDGDFGAAEIAQPGDDFRGRAGFDRAFIGTVDGAGNIAPHRQGMFGGQRQHRHETGEPLLDGTVGVSLRKRLGGAGEDREFPRAGRDRGAGTLLVGHQGGQHETRTPRRAPHDRIMVGHLRHPSRRDESRRLDAGKAAIGQHADQAQLPAGRDQPLFVLQPVARADLDDRGLPVPAGRFNGRPHT
ncbi:hypothetical protein MESS4_830199 [Mesorhizobium sp. STM 4661]|nr:hypothetical protein MESS4_830199 [Mesorhizobium sp. STM 4661]